MKSAEPRQLSFVFADSPQGDKIRDSQDESSGKRFLVHTAKGNGRMGPATCTTVTRRLLESVASASNLARALLSVLRNKGAPGIDGRSVEQVAEQAPALLPELQKSLLEGTYQPGDIRRVWIPKPGGGERGLGIPNVVDRWVQQAVLQVLEPIFEPLFHRSSHGFRANRGAHTAIAEAKQYLGEGYQVVVDLDLSKFFDRVHHQRLLARLGQQVHDSGVLNLVRQMLTAKVVLPDGTKVSTEEGTPQGGPLSPLLSNIVLDEWDWELERRGLRFVRYADDCNIFVRSQRAGERVMVSTRRYLENRLRLQINEAKSSVTQPDKVHFLGFRFGTASSSPNVEVLMSAKTKVKLTAKILEMTPRRWGSSLRVCMDKLNRYFQGWIGYFRICTQAGADEFRRYDAHARRRLRAIVICQKKRPRFLYRHLVRRGVSSGQAAGVAYYRRGIWSRSNRRGMTKAYPNAWFHGQIGSLYDRWRGANPPPQVPSQLRLAW
ncbi:MAG: group II intron reverse transcriptase/maturase [Fimbriimonadaceae bacterium]